MDPIEIVLSLSEHVGCWTKILVVFLYLVAVGFSLIGIAAIAVGNSTGWYPLILGVVVGVLGSPFLILWLRRSLRRRLR